MDFDSAWKSFPSDLETLTIRESSVPDNYSSRCVVTPIVTSSSFVFEGAGPNTSRENVDSENPEFYYGRHGNPTRHHLEQYFAKMDDAKYALAFGSGVSALGAIVLSLSQGDHVVSSSALYGGSIVLMKASQKYGFTYDFFHTTDSDEIMKLVRPNTKMIFFETPSNPDLRLLDISEISRKAHAINPEIMVVVDNTFLTPVLQNCLSLGADLVVYSTSKYIGGHADIIGGIVTMNEKRFFDKVKGSQEVWGGIPSPFDCYLTIRSLKTLHLRMEKHAKSGFKVAKYLASHPLVEKVLHPGLKSHPQHELALKQQKGHSGMLMFYIKGGLKETVKFMESVKLIKRAPSLGADISLVTVPAKISHVGLSQEERTRLGISDNSVRLSVGLERAEDLMEDIDQALKLAVK